MKKVLSRRTLLRGALGGGVVGVGLPLLEAMMGRAHAGGAAEEPIFGIFFWANGTTWHGGHGAMQTGPADLWTPSGEGPGYTPSEFLTHLATHQPSIASGLTPHTEVPPEPPGQDDGHMRGFMVGLTGDRIRPEGFDHPSHTLTALRPSLDQYVAWHEDFYGDYPPLFRSLVLGISDARFHDYGHWNGISYNGPDSQNLPIMDPAQLFALLFNIPDDLEALGRRANLLDAVLEEANDLKAKVGVRDKQRIDAHLQHLSEIQRRLRLSGAVCDTPPAPASSADLIEKTQIMADLLAVGLGCGLTRVFSFMLTSPATTHVFSNLGVGDDMHTVCHAGAYENVRAITNYQMQAFGTFLDRLALVEDAMGNTLLDRACILGLSEYGEGWQHSVAEMPVVIAGRANGAINPGVHTRIPGGNISVAHVTVLRAIGIQTPSFGFNGGETSDHLAGILA